MPANSVSLPDGSIYLGAISNGLFEGRGSLVDGAGDRYEGDFRQGRPDGTGVWHYAAGGFCAGEFERGRVNGMGIEVLPNGRKYQGEFKDDVQSGTGIYRTAAGDTYKGQLRDGEFNGTGVLAYVNGDTYEGTFKDGQPEGRGVFRYHEGGRYTGDFKNGALDGKGVLYYPNGDRYAGEFKAGQIAETRGELSRFPRGALAAALVVSLLANVMLFLRLKGRGPVRNSSPADGADSEADDGAGTAREETPPEKLSLKKIFTAPSVVPCDLLKSVLEGRGIRVLIKNEHGSAGACVGVPAPDMPSATFAWPEVWVNEADADAAGRIVAEMKQSELSLERPWKCGRCGETVGAELNACWNCETPKPE